MTVQQKNMKRVRVEAQERLDLPDFNDLQGLVDDQLQLTVGALMGPGGGCLSPFHVTLSTPDNIVFYMAPTAFQFYWAAKAAFASDDGTTRAWRGGVTTFDPANEGQQTLVDYTAVRAGHTLPFLYARPKTVDGAVDGRRKFIGGAAVSTSIKTRSQLVVEFKWSLLAPSVSDNDGWAAVAKIISWNGNTPVVLPISAWDSWAAYAQAKQPGSFGVSDAATNDWLALNAVDAGSDADGSGWKDLNGGASSERSGGLGFLLTQIRARLRRHVAKDGTAAWYQDPVRDLKVLDGNLTTVEGLVIGRPYIKCMGFVYCNTGANPPTYTLQTTPGITGGTPFGSASFTRLSAGVILANFGVSTLTERVVIATVQPYATVTANTGQVVLNAGQAGLDTQVQLLTAAGQYYDDDFFITVWCKAIP